MSPASFLTSNSLILRAPQWGLSQSSPRRRCGRNRRRVCPQTRLPNNRSNCLYVATPKSPPPSGLSIDGRDALKKLITDVQNGSADFTTILVYDVSRWGRFQDADESAYYEYICKRAGINVQYCAEQFENDGSPVSTIMKGVKRARWPANTAESFRSKSSLDNAD